MDSERDKDRDESEPESEPESGPEPKKYGIDPDDIEVDDEDDEPVPRLPRGKGISVTGPEMIRIFMFLGLLVAVVALRKPCSEGVARFMENFAVDAGVQPPQLVIPERTIRLRGDETEAELRRKIEGLKDAGPTDAAPAQ